MAVNYIAYDFGVPGDVRKRFYSELEVELKKMHEDGGIGLLINNVGVANVRPAQALCLLNHQPLMVLFRLLVGDSQDDRGVLGPGGGGHDPVQRLLHRLHDQVHRFRPTNYQGQHELRRLIHHHCSSEELHRLMLFALRV